MTAALFGYKYLLCLVCFVVYVVRAIDAAMGVTSPSGSPALTTAYPDGSHCIDPWKRHDQSCYLLTAGKYNFTEARQRCSEQGAHLVSISDDAENEFIKTERIRSSADPPWIGLYRQTSSCYDLTLCDWMWLDGNQMDYFNWAPDALPTISKCVIIQPSGFWSNDRGCYAELDAICKRDVWYPTPTSTIKEVPSLEPMITAIDEVCCLEPNIKVVRDGVIVACVVVVLFAVGCVVLVVIIIKGRCGSTLIIIRTSSRTDHEVEVNDENTPLGAPDHESNRGSPRNKDVAMEKQESETNAHGGGHNIYTEPIRKIDRPVS